MHVHLLNLLHRALRIILDVLVTQVSFSDKDAIVATYSRMIRGQNRRYLVQGTMIVVLAAALRRAPDIHGSFFSMHLISSTLRGSLASTLRGQPGSYHLWCGNCHVVPVDTVADISLRWNPVMLSSLMNSI